jgi:GTP-binding protein
MEHRSVNHYYRQAKFLISAAAIKQLPEGNSVEVAFVGRSNVGKSSAINVLCDNKGLAKTSRTPGRTRLINFFSLDETRKLVDLPGYGFAKVPLPMRQEWERLLEQYLQQTERLKGVVIIMDIRHPLKTFDTQMLDWCKHYNLQSHVLLTKADKLKKGGQKSALLSTQKLLKKHGFTSSIQTFSALHKSGLDELVSVLNTWLDLDE